MLIGWGWMNAAGPDSLPVCRSPWVASAVVAISGLLNRSADPKSQIFDPVLGSLIRLVPICQLDKTAGSSRVAKLTTLADRKFACVKSFRKLGPVDNHPS